MSDEKQQQTSTALVPALPPAPPESFQLTALQSWSDKVKTSGRGLLVTAAVVLGLVFGLGGYWSATAKIGGAVIVGGRVIAEGRNWVVQHLEGGILKSLAVREGDRWLLNGAKRWIGNATFADVTVIWAKDTADDQVKGFLVRKDAPGFNAVKIERKQALRSVQNADITLVDVAVPESDRLQRADSFRDVAKVLRATRAEVA